MKQVKVEMPGVVIKTTCELANQGYGCHGYEYIVTNPQKGDYIISKESQGALGIKHHYLFFDGEKFIRFTERLTKRSHKLLTPDNFHRFLNAYLAGTWNQTLQEIEEENRKKKIEKLESEIKWLNEQIKYYREENNKQQKEISQMYKVMASVLRINEQGGYGSRKKVRELLTPFFDTCNECGRPHPLCDCDE